MLIDINFQLMSRNEYQLFYQFIQAASKNDHVQIMEYKYTS